MVFGDDSEEFLVYYCPDCSNGFSYPFLSTRQLLKHYPDHYECFSSHRKITGAIQRIKSSNDIRIVRRFLRSEAPGRSILEIGAGSGLFLSMLQKRGFEVSGVEPSLAGVRYARENFALNLEPVLFEEYRTDRTFDMLIAFHVLEHSNDPVAFIDKATALLEDEGLLFLKVPRLDSWPARLYGRFWSGYDLPRHRAHFTKEGLTRLLQERGYRLELFKGDYGPLDTIRAMSYLSKYSGNRTVRLLFRIPAAFPGLMKLPWAVLLEILMSPFASGRMSLIAGKSASS